MTHAGKLSFLPVLVLAIFTAGCHKNDDTQPVDAAANGNLAPVSDNGGAAPAPETAAPQSAPAYSAPAQSQQQYPQQPQQPAQAQQPQQPQYPAQAQQPQYQDQQYQNQDDSGQLAQDVDQIAEYAPEPPPQLPEYQQPPCPDPNYIWTPGYWAYGQEGYYWVPGVWAYAPYTGALWTPGYWGYNSGRYGFHRGFWGRYIGYYGGVNYGNGYVGRGYYGGYWNNDQFHYNRQVTNVNVTTIHNTYISNVTNITTLIESNRLIANAGPTELLFRALPAGFSKPFALRRVGEQIAQFRGQIPGKAIGIKRKTGHRILIEGHQVAGLAVHHDLLDAARGAGHDGCLAGHGFQVDDAERLIDRWAAKHSRVAVELDRSPLGEHLVDPDQSRVEGA
jgi:hypothetical protein